jgi:hypothetical protein
MCMEEDCIDANNPLSMDPSTNSLFIKQGSTQL